jgi:LmbE family N-acetylglucosaminyl deacetylase
LFSSISKFENIFIIAPHQDDEVLGVGGTLCKLLELDKKISVIFTTDGSKGIKKVPGFLTKQIRLEEVSNVNKLLKNKLEITYLNFKDGKLENDENQCLEKLTSIFAQFNPDLIFIPNSFDWHPDHKASNSYTLRSLKEIHSKAKIYEYEVWEALQEPDLLINITRQSELKRKLIRCYKSQIQQMDFESAIMGLNSFRALRLTKSEIVEDKVNYAEAFKEAKL